MRKSAASAVPMALGACLILLSACTGGSSTEPTSQPVADTAAVAQSLDAAQSEASQAMESVESEASAAMDSVQSEVSQATETEGVAPVVVDPELTALAQLDPAAVCELLPKADVERITGLDIEDGDGTQMTGLGTNCIYYSDTGTGLELGAKVEFAEMSWSTLLMINDAAPGENDSEDCQVAGLPALCMAQDPEDDFSTNDVLVQLGSVGDVALFIATDTTLDNAKAMAEIVVGNLGR